MKLRDQSDRSLSDIISDQGGATDSISMNGDEGKVAEPSNENPRPGEVDNSSEIPDETPKAPVVVQPPKQPEAPKNVKKDKKVCVRK